MKKQSANWILLVAGVLFGLSLSRFELASVSTAVADTKIDKHLLQRTSESFREIAKSVGPAVVNIRSVKSSLGSRPEEWESLMTPFGFQAPQRGPQVGVGSGFFIDRDGHVVTNHHVIEGADDLEITVGESSDTFKATVVGSDPATDLAVLKVELAGKEGPKPLKWAAASDVEVGDWAIAIGSPFALANTLTVGVVSAKGRSRSGVTGANSIGDLIQTDTAINPGNSGGPLVNIDGNVMGINTAIFSRDGGYMGIGFAIPSEVAENTIRQLIENGVVERGWLGVSIQDAREELLRELNLKNGVVVHSVAPTSPARRAGLKAGDIIHQFEDQPVTSSSDLQTKVMQSKPGQRIRLAVVNYDSADPRKITVRLGKFPERPQRAPQLPPRFPHP